MKIKYVLVVFIAFANFSVFAQTEEDDLGVQEVQVTENFIPNVPDVTKISDVPNLVDSIKVANKVSFFPIQKRYVNQYILNPIQAAKIKGEPIEKLYQTYLYGGVGNMSMPTAQLYYSSDRSKTTSYALKLAYVESYANLKSYYDPNQKVSAAFRQTDLSLFAKTDLDVGILNAYITREGRLHQAYGYNPQIFNRLEEDVYQYWGYTSFGMSLKSKVSAKNQLKYLAKVFAYDLNEKTENTFSIALDLMQSKGLNDYQINLGLHYDLNNWSEKYHFADSLAKELILSFQPSVSRNLYGGVLHAGFEFLSMDARDSSDIRTVIFPNLRYEYVFSENYQKAFLGIRGGLVENKYWTLSKINPFILNALKDDGGGMDLKNGQIKYDLFLGMQSHLGSGIIWFSEISYSYERDMAFFELDRNSTYQNKFKVIYDDVKLLKWTSSLDWKVNSKAEVGIDFTYNQYQTDTLQNFAYKPSIISSLYGQYDLGQKILPKVEVFTAFNRSNINNPSSLTPQLKDIIDFNLSLEYRYNSILSAYFKSYNLIGGYQNWEGYPVLGPQVFFGLSLKL